MERDDSLSGFAGLFERAADYAVDEDVIHRALADRRRDGGGDRNGALDGARNVDGGGDMLDGSDVTDGSVATGAGTSGGDGIGTEGRPEPSPARVVADADVLAADLLVGDSSRDAIEVLWRHSWTTLVASDPLLDDAAAVIGSLTDDRLARDWLSTIATWREPIDHPDGDHPALASAYRGGAMQIVSLDPSLTGARAAAGLRNRLPVSVREPQAFATVFAPERLYPEVVGGTYPGPDREPRD